VCAAIGAALAGTVMPSFAYVFAAVIEVKLSCCQDLGTVVFSIVFKAFSDTCDGIRSQMIQWSSILAAIGVAAGFSEFLKILSMDQASHNLVRRIRAMAFRSVLRKDIGWFDNPYHSTGAICPRLAHDAAEMKPVSACRLIDQVSSCLDLPDLFPTMRQLRFHAKY
jgi:ABC-type multidrug transport system fused ATPase/permease subunit